jgi:hypothetical protein
MKIETYTSPSGNRYEIQPETRTRTAGGFLEDCPMYEIEETIYNIFRNDQWVQFALREENIAASVDNYENPGVDLGSRFD